MGSKTHAGDVPSPRRPRPQHQKHWFSENSVTVKNQNQYLEAKDHCERDRHTSQSHCLKNRPAIAAVSGGRYLFLMILDEDFDNPLSVVKDIRLQKKEDNACMCG